MKDYNADLYDEGGGRDADGKPCKHKVCTSYEDLMAWGRSKLGKPTVGQETTEKSAGNQPAGSSSSKNGGKGEAEESHIHRKDCPVNKDQLGRSTWDLLHTMSVYYPEKPTHEEKRNVNDMLVSLSKTYPCEHCAERFRMDLRVNPPELDSRDRLARWMCQAHNRVNHMLGKEQFDCRNVFSRWHDGWPDGSCDY